MGRGINYILHTCCPSCLDELVVKPFEVNSPSFGASIILRIARHRPPCTVMTTTTTVIKTPESPLTASYNPYNHHQPPLQPLQPPPTASTTITTTTNRLYNHYNHNQPPLQRLQPQPTASTTITTTTRTTMPL